jgi:IS5 family transposase
VGGARRGVGSDRAAAPAASAANDRPAPRGRTGSKHHLIVDSGGIPLAVTLTGGNRNDVTQLLPLVDGVGPVRGKPGRPRRRAEQVVADRGYDHDRYRREVWRAELHQAFLHLGCAIICRRLLRVL